MRYSAAKMVRAIRPNACIMLAGKRSLSLAHTVSLCTVVPIWNRSSSKPAAAAAPGAAAAAPGAPPAAPLAAAPEEPQAPADEGTPPGAAALLLPTPRAPSSASSATAARLAAYARSADEGASGPSS